ncbi:MAG: helix-turn-helix transcriptional regulator [Ignavibacteriales bacterium]|nr:helix-turn-helix transcriptional regulator [Ignavibacteriales bacterium]
MKKTANKKGGKSRLKRVLDEDGRKLKWLSESTGINYQRLQRITNQGYEPTLSEAVRLAQALRRSLQDLFPSLDLAGTLIDPSGGGSHRVSVTRATKRP